MACACTRTRVPVLDQIADLLDSKQCPQSRMRLKGRWYFPGSSRLSILLRTCFEVGGGSGMEGREVVFLVPATRW